MGFNDDDDTAKSLIYHMLEDQHEYLFVNGGDRGRFNTPESEIVAENLTFLHGIGGTEKINSSSTLVRTYRQWGYYQILYHYGPIKVKRLVINPRSNFSYQRHQHRDETWVIAKGVGVATLEEDQIHMKIGERLFVPRGAWHRMKNRTDEDLELIEVQYGVCDEADIERMF